MPERGRGGSPREQLWGGPAGLGLHPALQLGPHSRLLAQQRDLHAPPRALRAEVLGGRPGPPGHVVGPRLAAGAIQGRPPSGLNLVAPRSWARVLLRSQPPKRGPSGGRTGDSPGHPERPGQAGLGPARWPRLSDAGAADWPAPRCHSRGGFPPLFSRVRRRRPPLAAARVLAGRRCGWAPG